MQGGVDFAAVRARAQRHLLNQRPDRFRRLVTILWVVERFRQPLDLLPIDTRHVRMDVRNIRWRGIQSPSELLGLKPLRDFDRSSSVAPSRF